MSFLELHNIEKRFSGEPVVSEFSLAVEQGEFVSFLGGSGCGKTTTLRMIAGFETPTEGDILLEGVNVDRVPARKRNIGMVFQNYALFPNMTAAGNVSFGLRVAGVSRGETAERTREMLDLVHMGGLAERFPHQLSGGQQQRVALARALAPRPKMLLLDEPLSALDARIRGILREEIRAIQREVGITTIYVTHDQQEALSMSDRVVVMHNGRIEQVGTPKQIYDSPATQHVAGFIGTLNLLPASVKDASEGVLSVMNNLVRTSSPLRPLQNSKLFAAIRPERIRCRAADDGMDETPRPHDPVDPMWNSLSGTIRGVHFHGSTELMEVEVDGFTVVVERFNAPDRGILPAGTRVTLTFEPAACIPIYPGDPLPV